MENWLATQLNPPIDFNIFEFDYEAKHFVIIAVDPTRNRPVSFRGEPFIRIGSYKKPMDDHPERERKIWNRSNRLVFEKNPAIEKATAADVLYLIDYPRYFEMIALPLPENRNAIIERLLQDKIIESNGDFFSITNLGALLFAKNLELFEGLDRKAVRVIIYKGINRIKTIREQVGKRGYAVGFEGLINYILDQLPVKEEIDVALRKEITVYPSLAIRELVANVIIHQDFSVAVLHQRLKCLKTG